MVSGHWHWERWFALLLSAGTAVAGAAPAADEQVAAPLQLKLSPTLNQLPISGAAAISPDASDDRPISAPVGTPSATAGPAEPRHAGSTEDRETHDAAVLFGMPSSAADLSRNGAVETPAAAPTAAGSVRDTLKRESIQGLAPINSTANTIELLRGTSLPAAARDGIGPTLPH